MTYYEKHEECGDYLAFYAPTYYPSGGLSDLLGSFDYLAEAWDAIEKAKGGSMTWDNQHVLCVNTQVVFDKRDQGKGTPLYEWTAKEDD